MSNARVTLQELVENDHLDTVPDDFLVSEEDRVRLEDVSCELELPVIDMAGIEGERRGLVVQQIRCACEEWGFFQVKNHGVPLSLMKKMQQELRRFFDLPYEEKNRIRARTVGDSLPDEGYSDRMSHKESKSSNWSDKLRLYTLPVAGRRYELWPTHPRTFRETVEDYAEETNKLMSRILELISESLGLGTCHLNEYFSGKYQQVYQVNYYPSCPQPDVTMGLRKHSDNNVLTLVLQDANPGLQVRKDGQWITVKPVEGWFVVNVADQIELLSNGRYRSVEHRVFVSAKPRISVATFHAPTNDTVVGPIAELLGPEERPRYKASLFSEFKESFYYAGWAQASTGKGHLDHLLVV